MIPRAWRKIAPIAFAILLGFVAGRAYSMALTRDGSQGAEPDVAFQVPTSGQSDGGSSSQGTGSLDSISGKDAAGSAAGAGTIKSMGRSVTTPASLSFTGRVAMRMATSKNLSVMWLVLFHR